MKLFFNASLSGKKFFLKEYESIYNYIKTAPGVVSVQSPVFSGSSDKVAAETVDEAANYFKKLQTWMKSADIAVFEASYPSLGIGHEIAIALQLEKPVIVFHQPNKRPYILEGVPNDKLQLVEYELETLREQINESLSYALDQQDTRFNFFISPRIGTYLDWVSKKRRIPRAVYLRRLIEDDMKKNKEFEE